MCDTAEKKTTLNWNASWITNRTDMGDVAPVFKKKFSVSGDISNATLAITSLGVYEAMLNGERVGAFIMAPGWTVYRERIQYQIYDVTDMLSADNMLEVSVGKGWYRSPMPAASERRPQTYEGKKSVLLAQLDITFTDGTTECIVTDENWSVAESRVRFSEIYDGEIYDASFSTDISSSALVFEGPTHALIPQQGEEVREQERIVAAKLITTPNGEVVVDFGQEVTGYVEISVEGRKGDLVKLSHGEVLDKEGNFYGANYRGAKAEYCYICTDGHQVCKPRLTFFGFRYIRIDSFPGGVEQAKLENFTAIVVHSEMKRTGYINTSNPLLNRLFENVIWSQKGNFLDIPTDCPQRDERMGWTGDAQVFVRTACLNFDCEVFYTKWLADLKAEQHENGYVGYVVPYILLPRERASSAWGDAATICPWQVYLAYGNLQILENQFESMKKWVDYIASDSSKPYLWTGGKHMGDWLALDAPQGSYTGSSRKDFIASAFYAYSTSLVMKAGKALQKDVAAYEVLYRNIVKAFREEYPTYYTQTECALAVYFGLSEDCQATADQLADMVVACGNHLETGFVGTPYLLHVLSDYGHTDLAYSLLLREEYPSWLYSVTKGATTIWEHWDGIMESGDFWSTAMNSFNHYAYGAVMDWVYCKAAGIQTVEEYPGYEKVRIVPMPDERLDWLEASVETRHGRVSSGWRKQEDYWRYEITTPVDAEIVIHGKIYCVQAGSYCFYSDRKVS